MTTPCDLTMTANRTASRTPRSWLLTLSAALVLPIALASAQSKPYMGTFAYTMAQPSGDTKDFVNQYSWLGFSLEGDWFNRSNLSTGFILGWQEMYQDINGDSFAFANGTATGRTYRHISSLPLLLRGRYWAGESGQMIRAFGGLGVGTYWMKQLVDVGILTADENHWHFGLAPEVGVLMTTRGGVGWTLNARYNYPFAAGDYLGGSNASWSYWGIGIGVTYSH
jgi:hypothetical protein